MNIGDYVRTEWGIGKYIKYYKNSQEIIWKVIDGCNNLDSYDEFSNCFTNSEILKSSPNIIDLIEVGDYVNGKLIETLEKMDNKTIALGVYECFIYPDEIKSILTHEQFASIEYKLEDK